MDVLLSELKRTRKYSFVASLLLFSLSIVLVKDNLNIYIFGLIALAFAVFIHNFVFYVVALVFAPSLKRYLDVKKSSPKKSLKDLVLEVFKPTQGTGNKELDYHLEVYSDVVDGIQGTVIFIGFIFIIGLLFLSSF